VQHQDSIKSKTSQAASFNNKQSNKLLTQ
jgi:tetratricopeptide (TPR) repeat protein